jgi:hypothetical protein
VKGIYIGNVVLAWAEDMLFLFGAAALPRTEGGKTGRPLLNIVEWAVGPRQGTGGTDYENERSIFLSSAVTAFPVLLLTSCPRIYGGV